MTNQTMIFSVFDISSNIANVTTKVNKFIEDSIKEGKINFHVKPVVVTPSTATDKFWFTVQVNYYDPKVME